MVSSGCNAVLESLFACICNPDDTVLVPAPYYATFQFDLGVRAGVGVIGGGQIGKGGIERGEYYPTKEYLESEWNKASVKPKALLFSNPHNPLGFVIPEDVVRGMVEWADEKNIHVVSDEIYAGSTFGGAEHVSLAKVSKDIYGEIKDSHHVVYALSKDFAISGMRVGVGVLGKSVREGVEKMNDMCQVSSETQITVEGLLGDEVWVEGFRKEQRERVGGRYRRVKEAWEAAGVGIMEADAGMFCWVDMRGLIGGGGEEELNKRLLEHGIMMTPGRR